MKQKTFITMLIIVCLMHVFTSKGVCCRSNSDDTDTAVTKYKYMEEKSIGEHYNATLRGRGAADLGREEPNYVDVIGYVAISWNQALELKSKKNFQDKKLWIVPTYEKDRQFMQENGTLPHKTEVVVREQFLTHKGYGFYSGYLLVEKTDDKSQYYIDVNNFVTKKYWTYQDDLKTAAATGSFIAKYSQSSDYYPVTRDGEKVKLPNGTFVLVTGLAGTSGYYDRNTTSIAAIVWKKWRYGFGGVECYFNSDDLTITY